MGGKRTRLFRKRNDRSPYKRLADVAHYGSFGGFQSLLAQPSPSARLGRRLSVPGFDPHPMIGVHFAPLNAPLPASGSLQ
jgi:hypothetical protein